MVIFGAGGHGRVVVDAALAAGMSPAWIVDDHPPGLEIYGVRVLNSADRRWRGLTSFRFIVAVGRNETRERIHRELLARGGEPVSIVHPSAVVSPRAWVGRGTVVMAGVVVNPGARVGDNVILNTACSVDHDCDIADHVHLCPGTRIAGAVRIGTRAMLGTGTCVIPKVTIGSDTTIGAGSVVIRDLPSRAEAYGNPARVRRMPLAC